MSRLQRTRIGAVLAGFVLAAGGASALPHRTLVARPLPPSVLAAAESAPDGPVFDAASARALTDSLLGIVSEVRGLRALRPVPVEAASRTRIRSRLEEITRADAIEANLRRDEQLYRFLGVIPPDLDLVRLYHDLLEEQLAGFYDIDRRELVLAEWLPREHQSVVLAHELTHALQDQHFSLRVRKRLGFETPDAEAAWQALVEGDATAVMAELSLAPLGKHFTILADSSEAAQLAPPAARAAAGGIDSELFLSAPAIVREGLSFPYVHGLRYVMSLYRAGGWPAVDAAFVHPPASTEQILHAERIDNTRDAPIAIEIPDLRGMLGTAYEPVSNGTLGERELYAYIAQFVDPAVAEISAEGWGGCSYILYAAGPEDPPAFVLVSMWDSEDDAVEFFGGLIGALEARYPDQEGDPENSTQDQVLWTRDKGRKVNVLRLRERQVVCLEGIPEPRFARLLGKLDTGTRIDDLTPEVRARQKDNLPWNRKAAPLATGALRPGLELPADWARVEPPSDASAILEAEHGESHLLVLVDRQASNEVGVDGYAHAVAERLQKRGKGVYVQTDVQFPREDRMLYQHVFTQTEGETKVAYYIGAADLMQGYGCLLMWGPADDDQPLLEKTFYGLLRSMTLEPESQPESVPSGDGEGMASPNR